MERRHRLGILKYEELVVVGFIAFLFCLIYSTLEGRNWKPVNGQPQGEWEMEKPMTTKTKGPEKGELARWKILGNNHSVIRDHTHHHHHQNKLQPFTQVLKFDVLSFVYF